jgi:hypothetical protein
MPDNKSRLYVKWYPVITGGYQFQICSANHEALVTSQVYDRKDKMFLTINIMLNRPISKEIKEGRKNEEEI